MEKELKTFIMKKEELKEIENWKRQGYYFLYFSRIPKNWVKIKLQNGDEIAFNPKYYELLQSGYYALRENPKKLRQLFDVLEEMLMHCDNNVTLFSEILTECFPHVKEYRREKLYKWFPPLKEKKRKREIQKIFNKLAKIYSYEEVLKELTIRETSELLGSKETEIIHKLETPSSSELTALKKHKKAMKKIEEARKETEERAIDSQ